MKFIVTEVYTVGHGSTFADQIDQSEPCKNLLTIPTPIWGDFNGYGMVVKNKGGILACGGYVDSKSAHAKKCQHWLPGDAAWTDLDLEWNRDHDLGTSIAIDDNDAMSVSDGDGSGKTEIYSNGVWTMVADFPRDIYANTLVNGKSADEVISLGGHENPGSLFSQILETRHTYKYVRSTDTWVKLPDMPKKARYPSCGRLDNYVYCFGSAETSSTRLYL